MEIELTWEEYVKMIVKMETSKFKSLREAGRRLNINVSLLSKINNGVWIPDYKTMKKWFPKRHIRKPETIVKIETKII